MDWEAFWDLIEVGKQDKRELERKIKKLSEQDLVDFYWFNIETAADLKGEEFLAHWEPPYSDDDVDDVAQWVVRQGLDYYEGIQMEPDTMPTEVPKGEGNVSWDGVAAKVYKDRYGQAIRDKDEPPPDE